VLKWLAFVPVVVRWTPKVIETVVVVEGLFSSVKPGAVKKAEALSLLRGVATEAGWSWGDGVVEALSSLIDTVVRIMNAYKIFKHGGDHDPVVLEAAKEFVSVLPDLDPELVSFMEK